MATWQSTSRLARSRLVVLASLAVLFAALSFGGVATAASSPAAYRKQVNAYCTKLSPAFHKLEAQITAAQSGTENAVFYARVADLITLSLKEDTYIQAAVPPASMRAAVTAGLVALKKDDVIIRAALALHAKKKNTAFLAEVNKLAPLGAAANSGLDGIGLRDCGSDQG